MSLRLKRVNFQKVKNLVPPWLMHPVTFAEAADEVLSNLGKSNRVIFDFIEKDFYHDHVLEPVAQGKWILRFESELSGRPVEIQFPYAELLTPFKDDFRHTVYMHQFMNRVFYVGITKHAWHGRLSQHLRSSTNGSKLLFHKALEGNRKNLIVHSIISCEFNFIGAMGIEELFVDKISLYPRGLNMIPGGFAGYKYLSSLGHRPRDLEDRDTILEDLSSRSELAGGRINPLNAARWASDQDYINAVICGHSNRLTLDEVRIIRLHESFGKTREEIAEAISRKISTILDVLRGKKYGRVR